MSQPPQNPWDNTQQPQQPQQPSQPYNFPQPGYGQPPQPPTYPQQQPPPGYYQQPGYPQQPQGQWNPSGVYGGVQPPKKKGVPWWVWLIVGFVVIGIIGAATNAGTKKDSTQTQVAQVTAQATSVPAISNTPTFAVAANEVKPTATDRPAPTAKPTVTIKPTVTPLPPTITPNIPGTQAAVANITELARQKAQNNAQATAAALPKPIGFQGNGDKVSPKFTLHKGLAKCQVSNKGDSNIIAYVLNDKGTQVALCANGIGNYNGDKYINIPVTGTYLLNITSDGDWSFNIVDGPLLESQQPIPVNDVYTGKGDAALKIHIDKSGLLVYKAKQMGGSSNFIIYAYDVDGSTLALIANGIGNYSSEKAIKTSPGDYYFSIEADSDWSLQITQ
jgi:cytoskeletal protein RodZ